MGKGHYKRIIEEEVINLMASFFYSFWRRSFKKVLMIILIKNENEIGYKITLGRVWVEKSVELILEEFGREGFGEGEV